jgi:hypothetical protein
MMITLLYIGEGELVLGCWAENKLHTNKPRERKETTKTGENGYNNQPQAQDEMTYVGVGELVGNKTDPTNRFSEARGPLNNKKCFKKNKILMRTR